MDPHPTPLPVKANDSKPKINPKGNTSTKTGPSQPQILCRSTNVPGKRVSDLSITKPKIGVPEIQPKSTRATRLSIDARTTTEATDKKSPENVNPRLNKKSDTFPQRQVEKPSNNSQEKDSTEPHTPVALSHHVKTKSEVPATPFYTAAHCSKCRSDRLETSSYWVGHIKMAESVGKHLVAAEFFRLALESQAEPVRNLRIELKRYLLRHGYLLEQKEWREVAGRYGLLKVESIPCGVESSTDTYV